MPAPFVYDHRFHAGNVGDVFKHVAWLALLERTRGAGPRTIVDTHAGRGAYPLASTGEWTEALGALLEALDRGDVPPAEIARFVEAARRHAAPRAYPGSPLLAADVLELEDVLHVAEAEADARRVLEGTLRGRARGVHEDGLALLADPIVRASPRPIVLIDPPFADRAEWTTVPDALADAALARPDGCFVLWYPVKSYARPNAMIEHLRRRGLAHVVVELLTAPLELKKNRLNGSGLLFVRPPEGLVPAIAAAASWLGPRLSVRDGWFSVRVQGA